MRAICCTERFAFVHRALAHLNPQREFILLESPQLGAPGYGGETRKNSKELKGKQSPTKADYKLGEKHYGGSLGGSMARTDRLESARS